MKTVAIIGRSGTNAPVWIARFLAAGWRVCNLVREPGRVTVRPNLDAVAFDFDDPQGYRAALGGVDVLALVSPTGPEQDTRDIALIGAARQCGVGGIVHLSVIGAEMAEPISLFARTAARVEAALRSSGVPHVILRANGFMQTLLRQRAMIEAGSLIEPSGTAAISRVDVHDLADVAVSVAGGKFDGRALTLTGPAALTGDEMAAAFSDALGRPVRYVSPPLDQFYAALAGLGLPVWLVDALVELQEAILEGRAPHLAPVSADVERTTGHRPRPFAEFAVREFGGRA